MPLLSDLPTAIATHLTTSQQPGGSLAAAAAAVILPEDTHDLGTEITKAVSKIGLVILVGMPHGINKSTMQNPNLELQVNLSIAIAEVPITWRAVVGRPKAPAIALIIAQLLQNFKVAGFQYLRVSKLDYIPDKVRQLYEVPIETSLIAPALPL